MATVKTATFVKGVVAPDGLPRDTVPYIAFLGRSNVGKSSSLNTLTGFGKLARKSSRPGKTTEINLFLVNKSVYFADLPGYGFAKQPNDLREKILEMIDWYVQDTYITQQRIVQIVDMRIGVTPLDQEMLDLILMNHAPEKVVVIANKSDGLKQSEMATRMRDIQALCPGVTVVPFSARTGAGKKEALAAIFATHQ